MITRTDLPFLRRRSLRSTTTSFPVQPVPTSPATNPLDLEASTLPVALTPTVETSLDLRLSSNMVPLTLTHRQLSHRTLAPDHDLQLPTIEAGERRILTERKPVVQLTRMQSAAGALEARIAIQNPSEVILGCVFETSDCRESVVLPGLSQQGPDPRSPIFRATTSGVAVNLRRITSIHRLLLFAVATGRRKQLPSGTVILTTYGKTRLELPVIAGPSLDAKALMTAYAVEGRLVIRAEHDSHSDTLQQICGAYGYIELSWRDPFTPLV